tara:strand:+ start:2356 stop:3111 length:756 start_codon:yes stop_codon:yes gene_type:complete
MEEKEVLILTTCEDGISQVFGGGSMSDTKKQYQNKSVLNRLPILKETTFPDTFIESGSYLGDSIEWALEHGFDKIYSVDIDDTFTIHCDTRFNKDNPELWSRAMIAAKKKFPNKGQKRRARYAWACEWYKKSGGGWNKTVNLYHSSSIDFFASDEIIDVMKNQDCLFFLDGHIHSHNGINTYSEEGSEFPIIKELNIIKKHATKTSIIIIDDIGKFGKYEVDGHEIDNIIHEINPEYTKHEQGGMWLYMAP